MADSALRAASYLPKRLAAAHIDSYNVRRLHSMLHKRHEDASPTEHTTTTPKMQSKWRSWRSRHLPKTLQKTNRTADSGATPLRSRCKTPRPSETLQKTRSHHGQTTLAKMTSSRGGGLDGTLVFLKTLAKSNRNDVAETLAESCRSRWILWPHRNIAKMGRNQAAPSPLRPRRITRWRMSY